MWTLPTWERPTDWDEAAPSTTLRKPPKGIEPSTSPLPRVCSTTELRWHDVQTGSSNSCRTLPGCSLSLALRGARQSGRSCSHTQPERVRSSVIRRRDLHDLEREARSSCRGRRATDEKPCQRARWDGEFSKSRGRCKGSHAVSLVPVGAGAAARAVVRRPRTARQVAAPVRQGLVKNVLRSRPKTRTPLSTSSSRRFSHSGTLSTWPSRKRQRAYPPE